MRESACREAERWTRRRADNIRSRRAEQAKILRQDLEIDIADRLKEIDEEEIKSRGLIEETGQRRLFAEQEAGRSFSARRAAVESYRDQRLQEIAELERVDDPAPPQPLGALFLVPTGAISPGEILR